MRRLSWLASRVETLFAGKGARKPRSPLRLEVLEERTLFSVTPAVVAFDAATGWLSLRGVPAGAAVQVGTSGDALTVSLNGQHFTPAGSAARLRHIQVDSGDTLTLAGLSTAGDLDVQSSGAVTLSGPIRVAGRLKLSAASLTVNGATSAIDLSLHSAGLLDVEAQGSLTARAGGTLTARAGDFVNVGWVRADGSQGGHVAITARDYLNGGTVSAIGSAGTGGVVWVAFGQSYIDTSAGSTSATGTGGGGRVSIGGSGRLFSSGRFSATGSTGGQIDLFGRSVALIAATADASGTAGQGGRVIVRSQQSTDFSGNITAVSAGGGAGGFVEVSSHGRLNNRGKVSVGAGGTLRLDPANLVISTVTGVFPQFNLVNPGSGGAFGAQVLPLSTGNVVVTDPTVNNNAGAVYLFNATTGALLSSLTGSTGELLGSNGVTVLSNGNYVVYNQSWNGSRGAVTWGSGTSGITGTISANNSLVGSSPNDFVGRTVSALSNGNYVVDSSAWNGYRGAVTWGSGMAGITGVVSASNSLEGTNPEVSGPNTFSPGDEVGGGGVIALNNGNYVVASPQWNGNRGAVTWGSGTSGTTGTISASNSLVGSSPDVEGTNSSRPGDQVGAGGVTALDNGNYVAASPDWNDTQGAVTWGSGTSGITGVVSASNSLVGSSSNDFVGRSVSALRNGNYVVDSSQWNTVKGAVTWGSGTSGITGVVSASNSLVGSSFGDLLSSTVTPLSNGNYVVDSPNVDNFLGAVTWGSGTSGITGTFSSNNSLVGSSDDDLLGSTVTPLSNGNFVVASQAWNGGEGAVTWESGTSGVTGNISASNSLVGSSPYDYVGTSVIALDNGNYVVGSPSWIGGEGAATWGSGTSGVTGAISASNSLVGSSANDFVGSKVTILSNGDYVVDSSAWNGNRGAVTWGSGTAGITGTVSASNSLVGSAAGDQVGLNVTPLSNGNYVVGSQFWNSVGAATWASGTAGITGTVSASNSLVGSAAGDTVGSAVIALSNGMGVTGRPLRH